jgi:hypothetical protein
MTFLREPAGRPALPDRRTKSSQPTLIALKFFSRAIVHKHAAS